MSTHAAFSESETRLLLEGSSESLRSFRDGLLTRGDAASEEAALVDGLAVRIEAAEKRQVEAILLDARRFADPKTWSSVTVAADVGSVVSRLAANRISVLRNDAESRGRRLAPEVVPMMSRETLASYRLSVERVIAQIVRTFEQGTFGPGAGSENDPELVRLKAGLATFEANRAACAGKASEIRERAMKDPRFARLERIGYGTPRYAGGMMDKVADAVKADMCGHAETKSAIAMFEKQERDLPAIIGRMKARIEARMHRLAVVDYNSTIANAKDVLAIVDARLEAIAAGTADPEAECRDRMVRLELEAFGLRRKLVQMMNGRGGTPETALVAKLVRFDHRSLGEAMATRETLEDMDFRQDTLKRIGLVRSADAIVEAGTAFETELEQLGSVPVF